MLLRLRTRPLIETSKQDNNRVHGLKLAANRGHQNALLAGLLTVDIAIPGWASSVLPMYLLGGIQLLGIGVLGEYTSKIYMETKRRPRFIIEKVLD